MAREIEMGLNETVGKRLLNVKEAARYLGLKVDTIYKKARLRELPFVKVGSKNGALARTAAKVNLATEEELNTNGQPKARCPAKGGNRC